MREGLPVANPVAVTIVEKRHIDTPLVGGVGMRNPVVAPERRQRIPQQAQDMGVLHLAHAEQVWPPAAVELPDDGRELPDLGVELGLRPTRKLPAQRPLELVRAPRRALDIEQVLHVPERDMVNRHGGLLDQAVMTP